jgi:hypothetical protein
MTGYGFFYLTWMPWLLFISLELTMNYQDLNYRTTFFTSSTTVQLYSIMYGGRALFVTAVGLRCSVPVCGKIVYT